MNGAQGKPRLQRSKAQSRKTFRLRKSRRNRVERLEVSINLPGNSRNLRSLFQESAKH